MPNDEIPQWRVGLGTDRHRLVDDRPLILCGITIPFSKGCDGHSDGDAVVHAFIDACLGALGRGDIGEHFPDTDEAYAGVDSATLAARVLAMVAGDGYRISTIDATIALERPKLKDFKPLMRARLSEIAGVAEARVNVKAKTGEARGTVGRGEVVDAIVIVMLERATDAT